MCNNEQRFEHGLYIFPSLLSYDTVQWVVITRVLEVASTSVLSSMLSHFKQTAAMSDLFRRIH
jgi:hypothetical protein